MNYLVVSDSHGDRDILVELAKKYEDKVDRFFHCGDSELPETDILWNQYIVVKGNCDYGIPFPESILEKTVLDTIYMTHGHLVNVGMNLDGLIEQGKQNNANIVFFGHTHRACCEQHAGSLYLNPGSISLPRGSRPIQTYVQIKSTENELTVQYYTREHRVIDDLSFSFTRK